nr:hypothetical protein HUO10_000024 [Paraburkholderia busanensis]
MDNIPGTEQVSNREAAHMGNAHEVPKTADLVKNTLPHHVLKLRGKRSSNFWEPVFKNGQHAPSQVYDWDVNGRSNVENCLCHVIELRELMSSRSQTRWHVNAITYTNCDFEGDFFNITFKNCNFINCDFGSSTWKNAKFSNCKFKRCSFTLTTIEQSQFIKCRWEEIGISGTETKIFDTALDNPLEFINAAWTNLDEDLLAQHGRDATYQTMRLEITKTKIARIILSNNERSGDDSTYYRSVEAYLKQIIRSKQTISRYNIKNKIDRVANFLALPIFSVESFFLRISGLVNNWGASVARPACVGLAIALFFSFWYYFAWLYIFKQTPSAKMAAMKSFDVTLLFGYTKHAQSGSNFLEQISYAINAFLGPWWYAIFVPTVINRISRVR